MELTRLKLSSAFYQEILKGWLFIGLIFGCLIWVVGLRLTDISSYISEKAIQKNGTQAISAKASGNVRSTYPLITLGLIQFNEYDLEVVYIDNQGLERKARSQFNSMSFVDQTLPPVVWYNPDDPSQFALSWSVDLGLGRLAFAGFHWFLGLFVIGLFILGIKASLKKIIKYKAYVSESKPKLFEVASDYLLDKAGKETGFKTYKYVYQKSDSSRNLVPILNNPLIISKDGKEYVLGFESSKFPQQPIIVSNNLYEFDLSDVDKSALVNFAREITI